MNQDKFLFLDLFGKIDSTYIDSSFKPWRNKRFFYVHRYRNRIACAILVLAFVAGGIFHTEVEAALRKAVTLIGEMLGIEKDISSLIDIKNIPVKDNGVTLTIEEVALDRNQLLILVSQKFEENKKEIDTELSENVKINGVRLNSLKDYMTDTTLDRPAHKYVLSYYLNEGMVSGDILEIEASFTVRRTEDGSEVGEYNFCFTASCEELERETVRTPIKQTIAISDNVRLQLSTFTLNSIGSNILASCGNLPLEGEYYLKGHDDHGNQIVYRLFLYENPEAVFVKETDSHISPQAAKLELQLYRRSLGELNSVSNEGEFTVEDYVDDGDSQMEPLGERVSINIKNKAK